MACAGPKPRMSIKPVVIVLDNGPIHVSKPTSAALAERAHWLIVEWLPKYAPELNDIEIVWGGLEFRAKTPFVPTNLCLAGKKALVVGIASEDSIAFGWGMFRPGHPSRHHVSPAFVRSRKSSGPTSLDVREQLASP